MDTIAALLGVLVWTTSACAGALIGQSVGQVKLCAALGLLLGPVGVLAAMGIGPAHQASVSDERMGPGLAPTMPTKPTKPDPKAKTLGDAR